jgi:hypothetical protein
MSRRSKARHIASLDRVEDALSLLGAKTSRLRGKEREYLRSALLDLEALFLAMVDVERDRIYESLKTVAKSKSNIASMFDDQTFARASDVASFRNVMSSVAQLLNDTFAEEFEAQHKMTVEQAASTFENDVLKNIAANAVASSVASTPVPDKTGLN